MPPPAAADAVRQKTYDEIKPVENALDYILQKDKQTQLHQLANQLFQRHFIYSDEENEKKSEILLSESMLSGIIEQPNGLRWKILGMRTCRMEGERTEYDIERVQRVFTVGDKLHEETITQSGREAIFRLCRNDGPRTQQRFMHEYHLFRMISRSQRYPHYAQKLHFPEVFGSGSLTKLLYQKGTDRDFRCCVVAPPHPRSYFIMEKVGPSLEWVMRAGSKTEMPQDTSVFCTIGCLNALRILHDLGIVHRNVQPSSFALRLGPKNMLHRSELELTRIMVITDLHLARFFRAKKPRRICLFTGSLLYSSRSAQEHKEQTPADDLMSLVYMLFHMCTGSLPWLPDYEKVEADYESRMAEDKEKFFTQLWTIQARSVVLKAGKGGEFTEDCLDRLEKEEPAWEDKTKIYNDIRLKTEEDRNKQRIANASNRFAELRDSVLASKKEFETTPPQLVVTKDPPKDNPDKTKMVVELGTVDHVMEYVLTHNGVDVPIDHTFLGNMMLRDCMPPPKQDILPPETSILGLFNNSILCYRDGLEMNAKKTGKLGAEKKEDLKLGSAVFEGMQRASIDVVRVKWKKMDTDKRKKGEEKQKREEREIKKIDGLISPWKPLEDEELVVKMHDDTTEKYDQPPVPVKAPAEDKPGDEDKANITKGSKE